MRIVYKNTDLDIYINSKKFDYNINKDIDISLLRAAFNNSIGMLSKNHDSLLYWLMEISERNTLISDLFLDICKLKMLDKLQQKNQDITIYTNNLPIFFYYKNKKNVYFSGFISFLFKNLFSIIRTYSSLIGFIYRKLKDHLLFSRKTYKQDLSGYTILQTWVNDGNFNSNNFIDSYFPGLVSNINDQKILTWPVFYNINDKKKAIKYIRSNHKKFILSEDYLELNDYINTIKYFYLKKSLKLGSIVVAGCDMSSVFNFYQKRECIGDGYLFFAFQKNIAKNECSNINYIVPFENMMREKALIYGVKKYLSDSKVIGYFHTTKPDNILCLDYASIEESKIVPSPDIIIFNSRIYQEIYKSKYSNLNTISGLAYKQLHLRKKMNRINKNNKILVIFSGLSSEIKLMLSLLNSVSTNKHYLFRMHPMNFFDIEKYYFGKNFELVNNLTLNESLSKVSKVISTYSSVALESSLRGFFVGLVYNKKRLLIDPFDNSGVTDYQLISNKTEFNIYLESDLNIQQYSNFFNLDDRYHNVIAESLQ